MSDSTIPPFLSLARLLAVAALVAQHENTLYDRTPYHTLEVDWEAKHVDDLFFIFYFLRMPLVAFFHITRLVYVLHI